MIWAEFCDRALQHADRPAVSLGGETFSYAALVARARAAGENLAPWQGQGPARIVLGATEPMDLLVQILACWSAGRVPVIAREGRGAVGIEQICRFLDAPTWAGAQAGVVAPHPAPRIALRDEALVICTSGTTGTPRLVALPAQSVLINLDTITADLALVPQDLIAVITPLTYMYGLIGGTLAALWAGATVRFFDRADPPSVVQQVMRQEGVTVIQGPPSLLRLFLEYWNGQPFPTVQRVTMGGEAVPADLMARLGQAFPDAAHTILYGMTEAGPRLSHRHRTAEAEHDHDVQGCLRIGLPFAHVDWHLAPVTGQDLPIGAGRLVLRGPAMFLGYIAAGGGYEGLDAAGFFHSNDLLRQDADGGLWFVDRLDRMFKSGGKLVSPSEVEAVLLGHPAVLQATCRHEAHPVLGFVPVADVILHPGQSVTPAQIIAQCRAALQPHAVPRRIALQATLTLSPSGKRQM